jgi:hypothetical protein
MTLPVNNPATFYSLSIGTNFDNPLTTEEGPKMPLLKVFNNIGSAYYGQVLWESYLNRKVSHDDNPEEKIDKALRIFRSCEQIKFGSFKYKQMSDQSFVKDLDLRLIKQSITQMDKECIAHLSTFAALKGIKVISELFNN